MKYNLLKVDSREWSVDQQISTVSDKAGRPGCLQTAQWGLKLSVAQLWEKRGGETSEWRHQLQSTLM